MAISLAFSFDNLTKSLVQIWHVVYLLLCMMRAARVRAARHASSEHTMAAHLRRVAAHMVVARCSAV
jgi:hypothetical protein